MQIKNRQQLLIIVASIGFALLVLDNFVITCRKVSMTSRTLNSYIVNLNVFLGWPFQNGHITEARDWERFYRRPNRSRKWAMIMMSR